MLAPGLARPECRRRQRSAPWRFGRMCDDLSSCDLLPFLQVSLQLFKSRTHSIATDRNAKISVDTAHGANTNAGLWWLTAVTEQMRMDCNGRDCGIIPWWRLTELHIYGSSIPSSLISKSSWAARVPSRPARPGCGGRGAAFISSWNMAADTLSETKSVEIDLPPSPLKSSP